MKMEDILVTSDLMAPCQDGYIYQFVTQNHAFSKFSLFFEYYMNQM